MMRTQGIERREQSLRHAYPSSGTFLAGMRHRQMGIGPLLG